MAQEEKKKPAESGIKIENGYAELKPVEPGKKPTQVCIGGKTYKGSQKYKAIDKSGKEKIEVIVSKTRFVPEADAKKLPSKFQKLFL